MWSRNFERCLKCKKTDFRHKGHGWCIRCYSQGEFHHRSQNKYKISEKGKTRSRNYERYLKEKSIKQYSDGKMRCAWCGYNDIRALSIDHINDDGGKHRKSMNTTINAWLRTNKYPVGFQILCMNCNWIKEVERRRHGIETA